MSVQESFGVGTFDTVVKLRAFMLANPGSFRGEMHIDGVRRPKLISVLVVCSSLGLVRTERINGRFAKYWWVYEGSLDKFKAKKKTGIPRRSRIDTPITVVNNTWKDIANVLGYPTGPVCAQTGKRYYLKG